MLVWIGIALLSVSWLPGLGYYHPTDWPAWTALVLAGIAPLAGLSGRLPGPRESGLAALLALLPLWVAPWPFRAALLAIAVGSAIGAWPLLVGPRRGHVPRGSRVKENLLLRWLKTGLHRLSTAGVLGGCVLLAQALAMLVYATCTSRSHELPAPLAKLLGRVATALGMEAGVHETTLGLFSVRKTHWMGATWELFLDPATWCFLAGGIVAIAWRAWSDAPGPAPDTAAEKPPDAALPRRRGGAIRMLLWFVLPVLVWLPLRAGLLLGLYLHDVLRTDYEAPLLSLRLFWSTGIHLAFLIGPILLASRLAKLAPAGAGGIPREPIRGAAAPAQPPAASGDRRPRWAALVLAAAGVAILSAGIFWDPVGARKEGRVVVEEYHPEGDQQWERTDKPYDTEWYGHLSGYNYFCIYDYASRFYAMSRRTKPLDERALRDCDVLIVKIPTRPYAKKEIEAIERFVRGGGGLLVIGEHTNVFGSGTYLNAIVRPFGFRFRYDSMFGVDKVYEQEYRRPLVLHPIVGQLAEMDFATSCSIEPGTSRGRGVVRSAGLKSAMADYHASNFYPAPDDTPDMRYGAFVQLWAMRYGRGRVVAFSDSTIFSNFCVFEAGKKELWMGMIEWLNHRSPWIDPRFPLVCLGAVLACAGLWRARGSSGAWLVLIGSGALGWSVSVLGVNAAHRLAMPPAEPERPYVEVLMDETVCSTELPRGGFISPRGDTFGIFERWILRLGYFTARRDYDDRPTGPELFRGNAVVFLRPDLRVSSEFRDALVRYVEDGGKVLVVDMPHPESLAAGPRTARKALEQEDSSRRRRKAKYLASERKPTTNDLLKPFKITVDHGTRLSGPLQSAEGWPSVPVTEALAVEGGRPFAWVNGRPVGATLDWGNNGGSVTVVGYGSRFTDSQMGGTGDIDPNQLPEDFDKLPPQEQQRIREDRQRLKNVYQWQYAMFRALIEGKPLGRSPPPPR